MKTTRPTKSFEHALLLGLGLKRPPRVVGHDSAAVSRESLEELAALTVSADAVVVGSVLQMRESIDPASVIGSGKLLEVAAEARAREATLIIYDGNLTPAQQRNLENGVECRVIDRTQLILDIFAKHARSREGQLQVELAQLNYMLPRLTGKGPELSRLGGGIGTRGPGEQKLETDRRRIRERTSQIGKTLETLRRQRALRREARQAVPLGTVALVGYTNAGKSTLFNALSRAGVLVSSKMFATLDPTVRAVALPTKRRALFSDTVGFIRDLPKGLLAAFRATLEEVQQASLILHVSDVSNPRHEEQDTAVEKILSDLGVDDRPRLRVFNKVDLLDAETRASLARGNSNIYVSARDGIGLEELLARVDAELPIDPLMRLHFSVPLADGRTLALVHGLGRVIRSQVRGSDMEIEADLPRSVARRLHLDTESSAPESTKR